MDRSSDRSFTRELVGRAQGGDRAAFGDLAGRYEERLRALIHLRLGPGLRRRVDVEDILQETLLRAFEGLGKFEWRGEGCFFRWLGGIAEHVVRSLARYYLKAQKRMVARERSLDQEVALRAGDEGGLAEILRSRGTSPSKALQRNERFERLESALDRLSPDHREVVILARVRGLPIRDIARRLDRSPDAVSMLLLRALRKLKEYFGTTESLALPDRSLDDSSGNRADPERPESGESQGGAGNG